MCRFVYIVIKCVGVVFWLQYMCMVQQLCHLPGVNTHQCSSTRAKWGDCVIVVGQMAGGGSAGCLLVCVLCGSIRLTRGTNGAQ